MARLEAMTLPLLLVAAGGCGQGTSAALADVPPQRARVGEQLLVDVVVLGGGGQLRLGFRAPDVPNIGASADIIGDGTGGVFRWTPAPSHVGEHDIFFQLLTGGGAVVDETRTLVDVQPGGDSAPVFLRPGEGSSSGDTYDLQTDPCVTFDIEVRDADSPEVELREGEPLPDRAVILHDGPKAARFDWCPTDIQVRTAERWRVVLAADDFANPPVVHEHLVILQAP